MNYLALILGSPPHTIHLITYHRPLLHCFTKNGNLIPRFYRAQMHLTKSSKVKFIHTLFKHISVADMLSRSSTKTERHEFQLKRNQLPSQIALQHYKILP